MEKKQHTERLELSSLGWMRSLLRIKATEISARLGVKSKYHGTDNCLSSAAISLSGPAESVSQAKREILDAKELIEDYLNR